MTSQARLRIAAVLAGIAYGLFALMAFRSHDTGRWFGVMTGTFVFVVPGVLGFLTVYLGEREQRLSWPARVFLPWVTVLLASLAALLLAWEGFICIVLMLPENYILEIIKRRCESQRRGLLG